MSIDSFFFFLLELYIEESIDLLSQICSPEIPL